MTKEQEQIIKSLSEYLDKYPEIRFGQALFNLNINEFEKPNKFFGENKLRDIYNDSDLKILSRMV